MKSSYPEALKRLLVHEGGNDDDPRDPGGRTSRGIIQSEWNNWRKSRPGLPSDVWEAPQAVVEAIYKQKYWDVLGCDDLPAGVDYCVFDYGVNSGVSRAARVNDQFEGRPSVDRINAICDERISFLRGLRTWGAFGNGWSTRVREVRAASLAMATGAIPAIAPAPAPQGSTGVPAWLQTMRSITGTLEFPGEADNPVILAWRDEIAKRYPKMKDYCAEYTHDEIPWCGLTVGYVMAVNGIEPVFGESDTEKFLWADAWKNFGTRLDEPKLGCVMVFTRNGGGHVSLYEGEEGNYYLIRGGNQSDSVNVTRMAKNKLTAAVWPNVVLVKEPVPVPEEKKPETHVKENVGIVAAISATIAGVAHIAGAHPVWTAVTFAMVAVTVTAFILWLKRK